MNFIPHFIFLGEAIKQTALSSDNLILVAAHSNVAVDLLVQDLIKWKETSLIGSGIDVRRIGKKYSFKKYVQFALNSSCFCFGEVIAGSSIITLSSFNKQPSISNFYID